MGLTAAVASTPTSCSTERSRSTTGLAGFSLLELSLVILLMLIMVGVAVPRLSLLFESDLMKEARRIAGTIEGLRMRAMLEGEDYRLVFDTEKATYSVDIVDLDQPRQFFPHPDYPKPVSLTPPVEFVNVWRGSSETVERRFAGEKLEFDKIFGQRFDFRIDAAGLVDPFRLELKDRRHSVTVTVADIMGKVVIGRETPL
jgi:type II secretory pathway pseudopilin PulG